MQICFYYNQKYNLNYVHSVVRITIRTEEYSLAQQYVF
jgi:hypothetical protein